MIFFFFFNIHFYIIIEYIYLKFLKFVIFILKFIS